MEGISQEAISLAGHLQLGKLIVLYDDNKVSLAGETDITFTDDTCARFEASGWHTQCCRLSTATMLTAIDAAIDAAKGVTDRPSLIAVRTHIGYGSPLQDTFKAHGEPLGVENLKKTKEALGWPLEPDFFVPDDVSALLQDVRGEGRSGAGGVVEELRCVEGRERTESGAARTRALVQTAPRFALADVHRGERRASRRAMQAEPS